MIETVIFDIDNTLYDFNQAHAVAFKALQAYAERNLGMSAEAFADLHRETMKKLAEYMGNVAAFHNRIIRYQNILEGRGISLHPHVLKMDELYWNTLIDAAVPFDGAQEIMGLLKKQGIRIGIGTDMTARIQFRKLTRLGLLPYVDFLVSSEEAGAEKPALVFFEYCVKKAGCKASECLFVGDSLEKDVLGPAAAGMQAVWYCPQTPGDKADVPMIEKLTQLSQIVEKLS